MKLLFDTSVWVDDLRHGALRFVLPAARGRYFPWLDSVVIGELLAGCSTKSERRIVERLASPYKGAGRVVSPNASDFTRAGEAMSKLRGNGVSLRNPAGALLDAVQAADAVRIGALLVTRNFADFEKLSKVMPLSFRSFEDFSRSL